MIFFQDSQSLLRSKQSFHFSTRENIFERQKMIINLAKHFVQKDSQFGEFVRRSGTKYFYELKEMGEMVIGM